MQTSHLGKHQPDSVNGDASYLIDLLVGVDHLLEEKEMGGIRVVPGGVERRGAHRGDPGQFVVEAQFPLVGTTPPGRCEAALP